MSTTAVTPPASAPAAAPSTPAPASTPSTPVSTPAPATPAPVISQPTDERSMQDRLAEGWEKAKATVPVEEVEQPSGEEEVTLAPPAEEEAPPATAGEAEEVEEVPAPAAAGEEEEKFELALDAVDARTPAEFNAELAKDPAAKKFFDDRPELKTEVMGALRDVERAREIQQIIPDVDSARQAIESHSYVVQEQNLFENATTPEGSKAYLDMMLSRALEIGADGKPVLDPQTGKYKMHSALPQILNRIAGNQIDYLAGAIKDSGKLSQTFAPVLDALHKFATFKQDERLQTAAEVLRDYLEAPPLGEDAIPDQLKPLAESLKKREAALKEKETAHERSAQEQQQTTNQQSIAQVETKVATSIRAQLQPRLAKAGLSDYSINHALQNIGNAIDEQLAANKLFQTQYDSIAAKAPSKERDRELTRHLISGTNRIIGKILTEETRKATSDKLSRQADRQTKVNGQQKASAADPRGTSITPSAPGRALSPTELRTQIVEEYKKAHNGQEPDRDYVFAEQWKRVNAPPSK